MRYCVKCGTQIKDGVAFCPKCGIQITEFRSGDNSNCNMPKTPPITSAVTPKKKRKVWIMILLWIFLLPVMAIITIAKSSKIKRPVKAVLIVFIVLVSIGIAASNQEVPTSDPFNSSAPASTANSVTADVVEDGNQNAEPKTNTLPLDVISDKALRDDFLRACKLIGMHSEEVEDLKQVDDWVGGPRYSFTYSNMAFRLYCNMNSTVNAIKLGVDTDIYLQGFEPYQVSDYIVNTSIASELQTTSENYVKNQLNYPPTADFPWLDWAYGRERDLYSVSSHVTAKNAFGVEDELPFKLIYQVSESAATLLYFELDGSVIVNNIDPISTPERKKVETAGGDTESESGAIVLVDGQLGDYGETVNLDGENYINYHVPKGTYTITNNVKWCKVYLAKDKYYKNSDGYMENEIIETLEFSNSGETQTIIVGTGEHLELTMHATVSLVSKD